MGEILITQIDTWIHPGWSRCQEHVHLEARQRELSQKGMDRVYTLSKNPAAILLLYSAYPNKVNPSPNCSNLSLDKRSCEVRRTAECQELMRNRFFCFNSETFVDVSSILEMIAANGLRYEPGKSDLTVYGEYLEKCVARLGGELKVGLQVPDRKYHIAKDLSLSWPETFR